ncbi:MAG: ATP-binding protein [Methanobrevibacter sp.]|uniref:ATP-binding protein n=1 Tax=Methanobrevibacter sp. TaxID=66852 RepID=UPI0026DEE189|nr:ATP-binding protein [Methanobrevibacter sp.]MDO5848635.1 ATP-binding protein [Methanobrevibacter sp.]
MILKREDYLEKITPLIGKNIIKVLTGIRRCGKSIILSQIVEEVKNRGIKDENILFINFDSSNFQNIFDNNDLNLFVSDYIMDKDQKYFLFFDEIQNVKDWQLSISSFLVDYNVDIYITGSNANLLSGELATLLTGRHIEFKIYPFSFKEIISYNKLNGINLDTNAVFNRYIKFGGMPFTLELDDDNKVRYLEDLQKSIIFNDVLKRVSINNIDLLERLIRFTMNNVGQIFSANSISKYFKSENRSVKSETIYNYLKYLENACFIHKVHRKDLVGKKILKFNEKFFLTDFGFREAMFGSNMKDIGQILENIVYLELLRRGYKVNVGKLYQSEVDFVAQKGSDKLYIQVTYLMADEKTREREFKPLTKINDAYPKYVLSMDPIDYEYEGIKKINIIDFLLNKDKY